jgi:TonB family protein
MLKFVVTASFLVCSLSAICQTGNKNFEVSQTKETAFVNGEDDLYTFIFKHLKYSAEAKANKIEGEVMVSFFVEKDSTISNVKILKDMGYGCGDSIKALFKTLKYVPAQENGVPVRSNVMVNIPVRSH